MIKKLNPNINVLSVNDAEFLPYGKVINGYNMNEIIDRAMKIEMPEDGAKYELSMPQLEKCELAEKLKNECFGEIDTQVGFCWGYNSQLNGFEYHKSSEINIAVTPMVLLLGHINEMDNNEYNSENAKAFFVDKGEMLEIYGTTLHFCPCQVNKEGFRSIVILPKATNSPLNEISNNKLLFRKNKWLICHDKNEGLIRKGVYPGIHGENIKIIGE